MGGRMSGAQPDARLAELQALVAELRDDLADLRKGNTALHKIALDQCKHNLAQLKAMGDLSQRLREATEDAEGRAARASAYSAQLTRVEELLCKAGAEKRGTVPEMLERFIGGGIPGKRRRIPIGNEDARGSGSDSSSAEDDDHDPPRSAARLQEALRAIVHSGERPRGAGP